MTEIIEFSLAQVAETLKRDIHQIKDLVHDNPPAEAGEFTIMMTTTNVARRLNTNPIPTYQLEQRTKTGMQTLTQLNHLQIGHISHTKQIRVVPSLMDDHTIPHDYYCSLPEPQPGSYPGGKQLTSETPHMLSYKTASSLWKKKTSYSKGELKPAWSTETHSTEGY